MKLIKSLAKEIIYTKQIDKSNNVNKSDTINTGTCNIGTKKLELKPIII